MSLGKRTFYPTPKMREYVNDILETGRVSYGKYSRQFEQEFSRLHECKYGVLTNSGTDALRVALHTLKELHVWKDGDEVIAPALTFVATINAIIQNNLTPVLVDIDPETYQIDARLIEDKITSRTRAILPVHLFGFPCNMPAVSEIARLSNLKIVEDGCEIAFSSIMGKSANAWGDIGTASFYAAHIVSTGIGGMALTNNPNYARKLRSLVNHGLALDGLGEDYDPMLLGRLFRFDSIGYSARITEFEAALGLAQVEDWQPIRTQRQANYEKLYLALSDLEQAGYLRLLPPRSKDGYCPMMFPVTILSEMKHRIMKYLAKNDVGVRDALPLTNQPVYKGLLQEQDYPHAQFVNQHSFYLGCHPSMDADDLDKTVNTVCDFFSFRYGAQTRKRRLVSAL